MGKKSDRQARRVEAARWREFCDSWLAIGQAADREWRMLTGWHASEERRRAASQRRVAQLLGMAAALGAPMPCGYR